MLEPSGALVLPLFVLLLPVGLMIFFPGTPRKVAGILLFAARGSRPLVLM